MSLVVPFCASFPERDVFDEVWDLIESVSEGFPTYLYKHLFVVYIIRVSFVYISVSVTVWCPSAVRHNVKMLLITTIPNIH